MTDKAIVVSRLEPYKTFTCPACNQPRSEPATVQTLTCGCGKRMQQSGPEWKPTQDVGRFKTREQAEQAIKSFGMFTHFRFDVREIESTPEPESEQGVRDARSWTELWGHPKPKSADGAT